MRADQRMAPRRRHLAGAVLAQRAQFARAVFAWRLTACDIRLGVGRQQRYPAQNSPSRDNIAGLVAADDDRPDYRRQRTPFGAAWFVSYAARPRGDVFATNLCLG